MAGRGGCELCVVELVCVVALVLWGGGSSGQLVCWLLWIGVARLPVWGYSRGMSNAPHHLATIGRRVQHGLTALLGVGLLCAVALAGTSQPAELTVTPAPRAPHVAQQWTGLDAHRFADCVDVDSHPSWIAARLLVAGRDGVRSLIPFTDRTSGQLAASWTDTPGAAHLTVIGACR